MIAPLQAIILVVTRYYADVESLIDIRRSENIQRPVGSDRTSDPEQYILHLSPTINDCLYRNMYRFTRIAVVDFDEVGCDEKSKKAVLLQGNRAMPRCKFRSIRNMQEVVCFAYRNALTDF